MPAGSCTALTEVQVLGVDVANKIKGYKEKKGRGIKRNSFKFV